MTNLYIDIETKGLNAKEFISGGVVYNRNPKRDKDTEILFNNPKKMWNFIIDFAIKEYKRSKKITNVYAFNTKYDFYGIADFEDTSKGKLEIFSENPFIANYYSFELKKNIIKFLDVMAIYTGHSLERAGKLIGCYKGFTPTILKYPELFDIIHNDDLNVESKWDRIYKLSEEIQKVCFDNKEEIDKWIKMPKYLQLQEINKYMIQDIKVTKKLLEFVKMKLNDEGIYIKRLMTISQIAMSRMMNKLKEKNISNFFQDKSKNEVYKNNWNDEIRKAYKGGRCEVFNDAGKIIKEADYIDVNSLYPFALTKIPIPMLNTCRKIKEPLKNIDLNYLLSLIGVSECLVKVPENETIGLLPLRTIDGNYYGKKGQYILGSWTNLELKKAIQKGYEIIDIKESIVFSENIKNKNVFKEIIEETYHLRKSSIDPFNNWFYKMMMNSAIGKFGQYRLKNEIIIDDVEKIDEYIQKGFIRTTNIGFNYIYKRELDLNNAKWLEKSYYAPIICAYVNAYARCYMYDLYNLFDKKDLLYTDTDSIIFKSNPKYNKILKEYLDEKELGKLKIEHSKAPFLCYGRKNYAIGDNIKVSGYKKRNMKFEEFAKGDITSLKMIGIKSGDYNKIGTFIEQKHNLRESLIKQENFEEKWRNNKILIDYNIEDFSYFECKLNEILHSNPK
jgi:hypothetical protein